MNFSGKKVYIIIADFYRITLVYIDLIIELSLYWLLNLNR